MVIAIIPISYDIEEERQRGGKKMREIVREERDEVIVMVPDSSLNSWESWFIFTCEK